MIRPKIGKQAGPALLVSCFLALACGNAAEPAAPEPTNSAGASSAAGMAGSAAGTAPQTAGTSNASAGSGMGGSGLPQAGASGSSNNEPGGAGGTSTAGQGQGGAGAGTAGGASGGAAGAGGYQPCPTSPCVILPFGDSITYGYGTQTNGKDDASPGGYRALLFGLAAADNKPLTFVGSQADGPSSVADKPFPRAHEGHASYTIEGSKGIAQFVDSGIIKSTKPHIVLLMIGTNDVSQTLDLANAPTRLGKLLDKIYADAPNALIVLAKITPSQKEPANTNTNTYNAALSAVVQKQVTAGKHAVLVDMNEPFSSNPNWKKELMRDSVHPNNAGYALLAKAWYAAIRSALH